MKRQIIKIDEDLCIGCGLCASACHEGAIAIVNKKAKLLKDDYCDGLGNCLPVCPTNAISFEEREANEYNKEVAPKRVAKKKGVDMDIDPMNYQVSMDSHLNQWPVQIKLVPHNAPYFQNAKLLIAADCTAFTYGNFHNEFMKDYITIIGCPKLDEGDYSDKLAEIFSANQIKEIKVARMEVPCCSGIVHAVKQAMIKSGNIIPWEVVTISTEGDIM